MSRPTRTTAPVRGATALGILAVAGLCLSLVAQREPLPRDAVTESWRKSALTTALSARAAQIKAEVDAGASLSTYGILSVSPEIARDGFIEGTPEGFLDTVFAMTEGETKVIEDVRKAAIRARVLQ